MKTPTKRTTRRLTASLAIIAALVAEQSAWATDKYWVAEGGTGNWADANWSTSTTGSGTTFDSGSTALFHQSLNNIDLNGASPSVWSLRPISGTSASNRRVLNFYNTSGTASKITFNSTGNTAQDFKNMVVTFGGSGSTGNVNVYNNKNNNNNYSLNLKNDTHLVFAANSEYTERDKGSDYIGNTAGTTNSVTVEAGAKVTFADDLYVGNNGIGTLTINGGTVEVSSSAAQKWTRIGYNSGSSGTITLNGGQLKLAHVRKGHSNGAASLVFNGGALVANMASSYGLIYSNLPVTVNPGGGTIDNGGRSVTIAAALNGTGGMIFTGTGTTTLNDAVNYSGATAVTPGTTLAVANATAKSNILANGLVLAGVPTAGQTVMTYTSDLTGSDLSKVTCSHAPDTEFEIGGDGNKSILVKTVGATLDNYWTGAANDGNLSNAANWANGVPSGNANIFCTNSVTLTKGATFAPSSITFLAGSAKVTIDGDAITDIAAITNLSSVRHVFNCAVSGNDIDFYNTVHCCDFRGGITLASATFGGTAADLAKGLVGVWHFTGGWTPVSNNRIYENSIVTVDGELLNPGSMKINSGAVVTAATMRVTTSTCSASSNNGQLVVTGTFNLANTSQDFSFAGSNSDNATIVVDKIELNTGKWSKMNAKTLVVGGGGINFTSYAHFLQFNNSSTLYAGESTLTLGATRDNPYQAYVIDSGTLTVNTTQFGSSVPSTTTINGKFLGKDKWNNNYTGGMAVTGNGTLVFNSASTFTGGLTVKDSATVAVRLGACPGSGAVTLEDTSTLEVSQSGTVTLGGNLSITDGAALGFNFTDRTATPVLALVSGKSATAAGTVRVKIAKSDETAEVSSAGALLTRKITSGFGLPANTPVALEDAPKWVRSVAVVDGDIVLTLKSKGFFLVIK